MPYIGHLIGSIGGTVAEDPNNQNFSQILEGQMVLFEELGAKTTASILELFLTNCSKEIVLIWWPIPTEIRGRVSRSC